MKFTCEKYLLQAAVATASRAAASKSPNPALEGLLIEAAGDVKLTHGGVDNREAGLPALPGLKRGFIIQPRHVIGPVDKRPPLT